MKYLGVWKRFGWLIAIYALLLVVLVTTDPFRSPLLVVIVPFVLIFIALFMTFNLVLRRVPLKHWSRQKRLMVVVAAAWLPVMLLILRSINQLTLRDGLILTIFVVSLLLYISWTNFNRR